MKRIKRFIWLVASLVFCVALPAGAQTYADETADYGVPPTTELRTSDYHAPTPLTVPGVTTVTTIELKRMLADPNPPFLFDVLGGTNRVVIPGAILLGFDAGDGNVYAAEKARFARMLAILSRSNKNQAMVFYCLDSHCWLSYNAALRAASEGYTHVYWYRGGFYAWRAAGFSFVGAKPYAW